MSVRLCVSLSEQDANGQVIGAQCRDLITGRRFEVHAKVVINATGALGCHVFLVEAVHCSAPLLLL
jgi:glycerol-3-phosphate dehydrogenase